MQFSRDHFNLIVKFLMHHIVRGNRLRISFAVILGFVGRIVTLVGFFITFNAIVAAVRPEIVARHATAVFHKVGVGVTVTADNIAMAIIGSIIGVYILKYLIYILYYEILKKATQRANAYRNISNSNATIDDDVYMIEQTPDLVQSVVVVNEVALLILFFGTFLLYFSAEIGLLVLLMIGFMVVMLIISDRSNLRSNAYQKDARRLYLNIDEGGGKLRRRGGPEAVPERQKLIVARGARARRSVMKPQIEALYAGIVTAIIIFFMFRAHISIDQLAGMLVLFVVGIRYSINTGRDLSINLGRILELRTHVKLMRRAMEPRGPSTN